MPWAIELRPVGAKVGGGCRSRQHTSEGGAWAIEMRPVGAGVGGGCRLGQHTSEGGAWAIKLRPVGAKVGGRCQLGQHTSEGGALGLFTCARCCAPLGLELPENASWDGVRQPPDRIVSVGQGGRPP